MKKINLSLFVLSFVLFSFTTVMEVSAQIPGIGGSELVPRSVFVLQDFVDDFDHGDRAGGILAGFGDNRDASTPLLDSAEDRTNTNANAAAVTLETLAFGNTATTSFIGVSKTFDDSTLATGDPNSIDAGIFNAISFYVKGTTTLVDVIVELIVGDGGVIQSDSSTAGNDGSTWQSSNPYTLLTAGGGYERVVRQLDTSDFNRIINDNVGGGALDLGNITGINVLVVNSGSTGPQSFQIDDIHFFNNAETLTLTQERVLVEANGTISTVVITATTVDSSSAPIAVPIIFEEIASDGTVTQVLTGTTNAVTGQLSYNYTVTTIADIVEIRVRRQ